MYSLDYHLGGKGLDEGTLLPWVQQRQQQQTHLWGGCHACIFLGEQERGGEGKGRRGR